MRFKAAMFDFDGTVTEKGAYEPSQEIVDALVELAGKMPIAFCTGRQLESFEQHGMKALIEEIKPADLHDFLRNLYLFAENGSVGYQYNDELQEFEQFYKVKWPAKGFVTRDALSDELNEAVKDLGSVYYDAHRVIIVIRTRLTYLPREERNVSEIYRLAGEIYEVVIEHLKAITPNFEEFVHVGNAGIGVVVCPAKGDKDNGIQKFAEILGLERGITFEGKDFREILAVGDQPQVGGNDHYFLRGEFGTPYTVGAYLKGVEFPLPVLNNEGLRLENSIGTLHLIKGLL